MSRVCTLTDKANEITAQAKPSMLRVSRGFSQSKLRHVSVSVVLVCCPDQPGNRHLGAAEHLAVGQPSSQRGAELLTSTRTNKQHIIARRHADIHVLLKTRSHTNTFS